MGKIKRCIQREKFPLLLGKEAGFAPYQILLPTVTHLTLSCKKLWMPLAISVGMVKGRTCVFCVCACAEYSKMVAKEQNVLVSFSLALGK